MIVVMIYHDNASGILINQIITCAMFAILVNGNKFRDTGLHAGNFVRLFHPYFTLKKLMLINIRP